MAPEKDTVLRMFEAPPAPGALGDPPPAPLDSFDPASLEIDDRAIRYIARARETYADLRQCSAQLAGLLLLTQIGGASVLSDHPMLIAAQNSLAAARSDIWSEEPPSLAIAHRDHLRRAAEMLSRATREATHKRLERDGRDIDRLLAMVKEAWREMHCAALALPGFQVVGFGQSCCAAHASACQQRFQAR